MSKFTPPNFNSLQNETSFLGQLNAAMERIKASFDNTLSRDGSTPNQMGADLDVNSNHIVNMAKGTQAGHALEFTQLQDTLDEIDADIQYIDGQVVIATAQANRAESEANSAEGSANSAAADLATMEALLETYNNSFLGTFASNPTHDNSGNPLDVGDLYYNSVNHALMVYDGTDWQDVAAMTPTSINTIYNKIYANAVFRNTFVPETDDGAAIGTTALKFSDLFLASGAVINFNSGDVTITHNAASGGRLDFAGGSGGYYFSSAIAPSANDGAPLGSASVSWSDLFLASGAVINFNNGDVLLTHSANTLTFTGASTGYFFDAPIKRDANFFLNVDGTPNPLISFDSTDTISYDRASNNFYFNIGGQTPIALNQTSFLPGANDVVSLGTAGLAFSDLFLASGAVINFNSGDVTITHSTNSLAFAGASSGYSFDAKVSRDSQFFIDISTIPYINWDSNDYISYDRGSNFYTFVIGSSNELVLSSTNLMPGSNDGNALGSSTFSWADLFLASGAVVNFNNGDYTLTHSTGILTASGDIRISSPGTNSASVVTVGGSQTLTNKTLTSPVISTIVNTGTLTLPTATSTILSSTGNVNLTGGFTATSYSNGTISSGTLTPSGLNGNFQHYTANGAHTLAPPSTTASIILECLNGASAGAITTSGFTKVTGDTYSTTNTYKFLFFITKSNSYSHLHIQALQ